MAVYVIERLSSSIPDWLRQALSNDREGFRNSWRSKDRVKNYPLDKILFKNKGIPSTRKEIERDFTDGNTPVMQIQKPNQDPVVLIFEPDKYSKAETDSGIFNSAWNDLLSGYTWSEVKPYVLEYGVIYKGDKERDKLAIKKQGRREMANTLKRLRDPEYYAQDYQNALKRDANLKKFFKRLDTIYDNMTEQFNRGVALLGSITEDEANQLYKDMTDCKDRYLKIVQRIENELESHADSWDADSWGSSGYNGRGINNNINDLVGYVNKLSNTIDRLEGDENAEEI